MILNLVVFAAIFLPILSYSSFKYYMLRNHVAMKKRYSNLNMFEIFATLSKILTASITTSLLLANITFESPIFNAFNSLSQWSSYCIHYFQVWRFYMLRYDIIFTNIALNDEWKTIINPFYLNIAHINWYFKNKVTLGNYKWFGLRIILPLIIISSVIESSVLMTDSAVRHQSYGQIQKDQLFIVFLDYIPMILLTYLYFATPSIEDTFFIRSELKRLFICQSVITLTYTLFLIYHRIYVYVYDYNPDLLFFQLVELLQFDLIICCEFIEGMISTFWVRKRLEPIMMNQQFIISHRTSVSVVSPLQQSGRIGHTKDKSASFGVYPLVRIQSNSLGRTRLFNESNDDENERDIELIDIIQHPKGFELFIQHLLFEFSVECALSLIEMIQFEQYIYKCMQVHDLLNEDGADETERCLFRRIEFPSNIPLSYRIYGEIVTSIDEVKFDELDADKILVKCKDIAYQIAEKYIFNGSEYEINIRFSVRNRIKRQMKSYDDWMFNVKMDLSDLLNLYEPCCSAMYQLMTGTYDRFKSSAEYKRLQTFMMI